MSVRTRPVHTGESNTTLPRYVNRLARSPFVSDLTIAVGWIIFTAVCIVVMLGLCALLQVAA